MHRGLKAARKRLAELVAGHKQAFTMESAGSVKFKLLGIWLVIAKSILS